MGYLSTLYREISPCLRKKFEDIFQILFYNIDHLQKHKLQNIIILNDNICVPYQCIADDLGLLFIECNIGKIFTVKSPFPHISSLFNLLTLVKIHNLENNILCNDFLESG